MNFDFSIMKKLWDGGHKKLTNIIGRHGILDMFMDVSHTREMTICVVNQLKTIAIVRDCIFLPIHNLLNMVIVFKCFRYGIYRHGKAAFYFCINDQNKLTTCFLPLLVNWIISGIFTTELGLSAWLALERMNDSDTFHINWLQQYCWIAITK